VCTDCISFSWGYWFPAQEFECLSGITGTAKTEAEELWLMYNLTVVTVPQNRPNIRKDWPTDFFLTEELKLQAILDEVVACYDDYRPILVGTTSIQESEEVARMLAR
jgi:preprotein translocase subunit SecA